MIFIISKKKLVHFMLCIMVIILIGSGFHVCNKRSMVTSSDTKGYIALVIDDFGNHGDGTDEVLALGIPITAAVMPFTPYSEYDANAAHEAGLEVIIHIPMEPVHGRKEWLGPRGITTNLSDEEIQLRINEGLDLIKWAVGMNNHMGSKVTQDKRIIRNILKIAKQRNLFFLDSQTTENSIVSEIAKEIGIVSFKRDIFLDNSKNKENIENQLIKLGDIALQKGYAIGIGHVGPEGGTITAEVIKSVYPELEKKGITFIYLSQLKDICASIQ